MRKKLSIIILTVIICLVVSGCGNSNLYATVTYSDGSTETLEVGEIPELIRENAVAYNSKYPGCGIEVVDKVSSISSGYGENGYISVNTRNGWNVSLKKDTPVLIDLREGTTVKITGKLLSQSWTIGGAEVTIVE